ncbi:hypothetical protein jhhlp_003811 [Lomentospora prolificans]|uniref:AMP-dependent synthetase/ligase domain-containing protein n=1 Tax=Lomentospora prolificans TaxID=41688 RepID=A0A2N3N9W6_9PEZI|nr:hypothetical protein jhhlp_003811 [Lomentospora prolificans]
MVFHPPSWVPQLPAIPDSITLEQFMSDETYGRKAIDASLNPYTCGLTGKTYTASEVKQRTSFLSRAIGKRLGFAPNEDTPWDKVVAIFSVNTIDYIPVSHAVHRLSGIVTPASAAYSAAELEHQLKSSGARALFTCAPLLETALKAADAASIPRDKIFILEVAGARVDGFVAVDDLVREGQQLAELEPLKWHKGQGARQPAYLCYSSGTSGLPKAVMISHRNVIANVLQIKTYESVSREQNKIGSQVALGLLPFSHIYALVVVCHAGTYRGDEVVVLPKFELERLLAAVQKHKIQQMCIQVPPIIIALLRNQPLVAKYDLSSMRVLYSGAAPLGSETIDEVLKLWPNWRLCQGYGMTETSTVVCTTSEDDTVAGTSGSLVPGTKAKIIDFDGNEVTSYDTPGELYVQSPSVVLGYLNNEKANAETFVHHEDGRWIRTGDEVLVRLTPSGAEHLVIVDRIKELIKVKGHQVAPAELEAHLLTSPLVSDCAVIQVPDERAGEVPKAYVVKGEGAVGKSDIEVARNIAKYVEEHKARHKWLKGGIEFIDVIPKSPSGKILRRMLRDKEKEARRAKGAKL